MPVAPALINQSLYHVYIASQGDMNLEEHDKTGSKCAELYEFSLFTRFPGPWRIFYGPAAMQQNCN